MKPTTVAELVANELTQIEIVRPTDVGPAKGDPTNDMRSEARRACIGCGAHHGSVGAGILCIEGELTRVRAEFAPFRPHVAEIVEFLKNRVEFAEWMQLRREISALPSSHVKERGR